MLPNRERLCAVGTLALLALVVGLADLLALVLRADLVKTVSLQRAESWVRGWVPRVAASRLPCGGRTGCWDVHHRAAAG
ncbi:hypothetical protein GCM10009779_64920 [Polymorphospora rubra]|uniref:Uncharacterized protein n=1 Tax=Polymorphospora rubra TaxID=338584 RepID=A0A810MX45_9ACTN|nr:hypothetical protein Prubr_20950 [Polymorphospora rubra]